MFGSRYQRTSLVLILFENGIFAINVEFTFTLEIEVILIIKYVTRFDSNLKSISYVDNLLKPTSFTFVSDAIYAIIVNVI